MERDQIIHNAFLQAGLLQPGAILSRVEYQFGATLLDSMELTLLLAIRLQQAQKGTPASFVPLHDTTLTGPDSSRIDKIERMAKASYPGGVSFIIASDGELMVVPCGTDEPMDPGCFRSAREAMDDATEGK